MRALSPLLLLLGVVVVYVTSAIVVLRAGSRGRREEYVSFVVMFLHTGKAVPVPTFGVPALAERAARLPSTPAARKSLLSAEVLPKHQIHLGNLPGSVPFALV